MKLQYESGAQSARGARNASTVLASLLHRQMGVVRVAASVDPWPFRLERRTRAMSEERLIKKYANRRLYDASQSRHITLDDVRNLIAGGVRVKVVEDKTNEDITRLILLQVIADQEQLGRPILSTPLLEALIRFYGNAQQGFLSDHLEKSVASFVLAAGSNGQEAAETQG